MANPITPILFFNNVEDALQPLSAGTNTDICVVICNGPETEKIPVPHPVWTNSQGKAVVQMNMVELSGINGLYS